MKIPRFFTSLGTYVAGMGLLASCISGDVAPEGETLTASTMFITGSNTQFSQIRVGFYTTVRNGEQRYTAFEAEKGTPSQGRGLRFNIGNLTDGVTGQTAGVADPQFLAHGNVAFDNGSAIANCFATYLDNSAQMANQTFKGVQTASNSNIWLQINGYNGGPNEAGNRADMINAFRVIAGTQYRIYNYQSGHVDRVGNIIADQKMPACN